jgi:hypothetical protein
LGIRSGSKRKLHVSYIECVFWPFEKIDEGAILRLLGIEYLD